MHAVSPPSPDATPDSAGLARSIHVREGVGISAHVLQGRGLEILRMRVDQPALVLVDRGIKAVRTQRGVSVRAVAGQAILIDGNQTVDFTNSVPDGSHYEARWLVFDAAVLGDPYFLGRCAQHEAAQRNQACLRLLPTVSAGLTGAFENARHALIPQRGMPEAIARNRVMEVLHWLLEAGFTVRNPSVNPSVSVRVRALVAGRLDSAWTAERVAGALAQSEATLRRRLAAEGTSLTELLADARMATALTLLQATGEPVSQIALAVGYESPSRFASRFRQRFGFAPTAVRGHERQI